jgi:hypothetical protein
MKMNSSAPDSVQNQDDTSDSPQPQLQTLIFSATLTFTHHIPLRKGEKAGNTQIQSQVDPKQKVKFAIWDEKMRIDLKGSTNSSVDVHAKRGKPTGRC